MSKNVLVVVSKQESALRNQIEDVLEGLIDRQGERVIVHMARNRSEAIERMEQIAMQFAIVGHALALDKVSPVEEDGGIRLCEQLRFAGLAAPIILLLPLVTQLTNKLLERCRQLEVSPYHTDTDVFEYVEEQVRQFVPPRTTLDVLLCRNDDGGWTYEMRGVNFRYGKSGAVPLKAATLDQLSMLSRLIGKEEGQAFHDGFNQVGRNLRDALFESSDLERDLCRGIKLAGGVERVRISFAMCDVDRTHFPIALEALHPPLEYPPIPWLVRAPMSRNIKLGYSVAKPLFGKWAPPLNMLLVNADSHGWPDGVVSHDGRTALRLSELRHVSRECEGLQKLLRPHTGAGSLRELLPLSRKGDLGLSRSTLFKALEKDWNIVHFAGHSYAREDGDRESRGYLFVGRPGSPEAIPIGDIAPFLRRTTLVYLSSCESTSPAFALELARQGVPIVVGFRWKVDDWFAALHAHLFYRYLFEEKTVEMAFLRTRRAMHRRFGSTDRSWAASMLVFGETA